MDYVYHNMSAFVSPGFPAVSNQAQELYGKTPDFEGHALDSLVPLGYVAPTDHYISNSMDTVPVPYARPPSNASPSSDHHDIDGPSMGPPTKTRKKKAPTLRPADWEPYKARIIELHITQDPPLSLKEVKDTMEREFGFVAEYVSSGMRGQGKAFEYYHTDCYFHKATAISNAYKPMGSRQEY